ncbi:MAG: hypothetical protein KJI72_03225 [Patescibacteria group bacterium]|nr:hypothetical protein [Patescibacteria group bacterium]
MINEAIKSFSKQFIYKPKVENQEKLKKFSGFIVVGMGGSNLATGLVKIWKPQLNITIHQNYGLPVEPKEDLRDSLIILSSYSGSTEEVIDAFQSAGEEGLARAVISTGGELLDLAKKEEIAYIQIPDTGIEPRLAIGFSFKALLKIMGEEKSLDEVNQLPESFNPASYKEAGRSLAEKLEGSIPVVYSSARNGALAYVWKVSFNEGGKIPCFYNVLPELNHNEMTSFDVTKSTSALSEKFHFIFLRDDNDTPRILKRMEVLERLYRDRGFRIKTIELEGESVLHKIFSSVILVNWAAYYTALQYNVEPEQVPMVEEFKKLIK